MYVQQPSPDLEIVRKDVVEKFSNYLLSEICLAQNGNGFFEEKYWRDYLIAKYQYQAALNKFYVLVHELAK